MHKVETISETPPKRPFHAGNMPTGPLAHWPMSHICFQNCFLTDVFDRPDSFSGVFFKRLQPHCFSITLLRQGAKFIFDKVLLPTLGRHEDLIEEQLGKASVLRGCRGIVRVWRPLGNLRKKNESGTWLFRPIVLDCWV